MKTYISVIFLGLSLALTQSCGVSLSPDSGAGSDGGQAKQASISDQIFSGSFNVFQISVFYEPGAEPYTGALGLTGADTWDVTRESFTELFSSFTSRSIGVDSDLQDMQSVGAQNRSVWTIQQLISLGESVSPKLAVDDQLNVSIIFVNGKYEGGDSVLGVHPTGYPFAFVFKDVVESVGADQYSQQYIEQATVVHELGHVVGLVNNGIPMAQPHEDASHRHHTSNDDCVMYWAVESSSSILTFLTDIIAGQELQLFGPEVLDDASTFAKP